MQPPVGLHFVLPPPLSAPLPALVGPWKASIRNREQWHPEAPAPPSCSHPNTALTWRRHQMTHGETLAPYDASPKQQDTYSRSHPSIGCACETTNPLTVQVQSPISFTEGAGILYFP